MKRFIASLLCLILVGCFSFNVGNPLGRKKKGIPSKPQTPRILEEIVQKEADISSKLAQKIHAAGTEARTIETGILVESTDKIATYVGKPSKPIDLSDWRTIEKLHREFEKEVSRHRSDVRNWENKVLALREERSALLEENGGLRSALAKAKWWFWFMVFTAGILCLVFPSLFPVFVRYGKSVVKAVVKTLKGQAKEIVDAVQEIRKDGGLAVKIQSELRDVTDNIEDARALAERISDKVKARIDEILGNRQSADTKLLIANLKKGVIEE